MTDLIEKNKNSLFSAIGGAILMLIITTFVTSVPTPWAKYTEYIEFKNQVTSQYTELKVQINAMREDLSEMKGTIRHDLDDIKKTVNKNQDRMNSINRTHNPNITRHR